jgi:hypothetical protein
MNESNELAVIEELVGEQPDMLVPVTGELVDLRDVAAVALAVDAIRAAKHQLDAARQTLELVLRLEALKQGTKTLHLDGLDVVISGGEKTEYDCELLQQLLQEAGLPENRIREAIVETVSYKVDGRVARQLAGANPAYRAALERAQQTVPIPWRVAIRR